MKSHLHSNSTLLRRLGWAGFLFFLAKGIAWLALGSYLTLRGLSL